MFKLVISDDEGKTTAVPLVREEITIGRKEGNTIRLTDRNVSRRHAKLQKQSGTYLLQDLGSYNGTIINGTRVSDTRSIKHGDQIVIGDYKLAIVEESAVQTAPAASAAASTPPANASPQAVEAPMMAPPANPSGGHVGQMTVPAIPSALPVNPDAIVVPDDIQQLRLVFLAPAGTPGPVSITKLPMLFGRSELADISLPFSSISREHARLTLDNGQLVIEDLGSSNGVTVNGTRVTRQAVQKGDICAMGVVEFRVALHGDATMVMAASTLSVPETTEPKKSNAGMMAGAGILAVLLIGGGSIVAIKNMGSNTSTSTNSTVITGGDPTIGPVANNSNAQPATNPTANPNSNGAEPVNAAANPAVNLAANPPANQAANTPTIDPPNGNSAPQNGAENPPLNANPPANTAAQNDPGQNSNTGSHVRTNRNTTTNVAAAANVPPVHNPGTPITPRITPSANTNATGTSSTNGASQTTTQSTSTGTSSNTGANTAASSAGTAAAAGGANPSAQASACLLASDFNCVIAALRTRAATENEFNMLVSAYRGLRNTAALEQTMRRYLSRFPTGRYADRYRDTLGD